MQTHKFYYMGFTVFAEVKHTPEVNTTTEGYYYIELMHVITNSATKKFMKYLTHCIVVETSLHIKITGDHEHFSS